MYLFVHVYQFSNKLWKRKHRKNNLKFKQFSAQNENMTYGE